MPTIREVTIYKFEELTDEAKEKARDWFREGDGFHAEMEPFETVATILGISNIDISYSGFCSQGDGASFTGDYSHAVGASKAIREEFPIAETLHAIADDLTAIQSATRLLHGVFASCYITKPYGGCNTHHSGTMDIQTSDSFENGDAPFDEEREKVLLAIFRRLADWIYKSLEEDYEYQNSNEYVDDAIIGNEYEFDEDGDRA